MNVYSDNNTAKEYLDYLDSRSGLIHKQVLGDAILASLQATNYKLVLDAACGDGWMTKRLVDAGFSAEGCEASPPLLAKARKLYPNLKFNEADLTGTLPYQDNYFDAAIINMAVMDISDVTTCFKNLHRVLKPNGRVIITMHNPEYAYPVGVWKRGFFGWLMRRKPKLILRPKPVAGTKIDNGSFSTFWRPLDVYINSATAAKLTLTNKIELRSKKDSPEFDLNYQLYRYPVLILLELKK